MKQKSIPLIPANHFANFLSHGLQLKNPEESVVFAETEKTNEVTSQAAAIDGGKLLGLFLHPTGTGSFIPLHSGWLEEEKRYLGNHVFVS